MALSNRRLYGDDRPVSRRSIVDRVQSTVARLSLKQLVLLCVVATLVARIGWKGDSSSSEGPYSDELDEQEAAEEQSEEQPVTQAPFKSWRDQLDDLRELKLPGG